MKFWHKAFLCTLVLFLVAFDITAYLLVNKGMELNRDYAMETAQNEYRIIEAAIRDRLASAAEYYTHFNADNLHFLIDPYGDYYKMQGVYIELSQQQQLLYSSSPDPLPDSITVTGETFMGMTLTYHRDAWALADYRVQIVRYAVTVGIFVSLVLSIIIVAMLLALTQPIRQLGQAAHSISRGNYRERAKVRGSDEISDFAGSFNDMAARVEEHIAQLQRFTDNLSHEMRTPIAAIVGYGEYLQNANYTPEEQRVALGYIVKQGMRLQALSSKMLLLSNLRHTLINQVPVDLWQILDRVLQTLSPKDIMVDGESTIVMGDADLLESLLQNLIENATNAGRGVRVFIGTRDGKVCVTVSDDGTGIAPEDAALIFEPFYRPDKARSRTIGGAGLGLSICKRICELHHATISLSSKPDKGTTVIVEFAIP